MVGLEGAGKISSILQAEAWRDGDDHRNDRFHRGEQRLQFQLVGRRGSGQVPFSVASLLPGYNRFDVCCRHSRSRQLRGGKSRAQRNDERARHARCGCVRLRQRTPSPPPLLASFHGSSFGEVHDRRSQTCVWSFGCGMLPGSKSMDLAKLTRASVEAAGKERQLVAGT